MNELFRGVRRRHFGCIAADVPWHHTTWSKKGRERSAKYATMTLEEIAALPVGDFAAPDAFLLFWITGPFLAVGAHVPIMSAWGFRPSSLQHVWLKPTRKAYEQGHLFNFLDIPNLWKMGLGKTSRQNAEFVVLGRRGDPRRLSAAVRQEIIEPARAHSQKPEKFYEAAEKFCAGPRLDVFGRTKRVGWTVVGNEAGKFGRVPIAPPKKRFVDA